MAGYWWEGVYSKSSKCEGTGKPGSRLQKEKQKREEKCVGIEKIHRFGKQEQEKASSWIMYCMESWTEQDFKNQTSCEEKNRRWR